MGFNPPILRGFWWDNVVRLGWAITTVGGRNPSPVDMVVCPIDLQGFIHARWCHGNPKPSFLGVISYNPYFDGLQPSFFMVVVSKGKNSYEKHTAIEQKCTVFVPISFQKVQ